MQDDDLPVPDREAPQEFNLKLPPVEELDSLLSKNAKGGGSSEARSRGSLLSPIQQIIRRSLLTNHPGLTEQEIAEVLRKM